MPIYEYECKKCKSHLEVFQKINDKPRTKCDKCGGRLEKLISASAIQFKGSGWYVTDYAGKANKAAEKSESESSSSSATEDKASDKKQDKKTKEAASPTKTSSKASTSKASTD